LCFYGFVIDDVLVNLLEMSFDNFEVLHTCTSVHALVYMH